MHTDLLDKPIVLSLNRAWQVIGHRTVKQALVAPLAFSSIIVIITMAQSVGK